MKRRITTTYVVAWFIPVACLLSVLGDDTKAQTFLLFAIAVFLYELVLRKGDPKV